MRTITAESDLFICFSDSRKSDFRFHCNVRCLNSKEWYSKEMKGFECKPKSSSYQI